MIALAVALWAASAGVARSQPASSKGRTLAEAAERQVGTTTTYDPAYRRLAYPGGGGLYHIGIVARARTKSGRPLVVHNIGRGAQVEDVLDEFEKIGHYRW